MFGGGLLQMRFLVPTPPSQLALHAHEPHSDQPPSSGLPSMSMDVFKIFFHCNFIFKNFVSSQLYVLINYYLVADNLQPILPTRHTQQSRKKNKIAKDVCVGNEKFAHYYAALESYY